MSTDNKTIIEWFGYSRRERRSTFILLFILIIIIALRYIFPSKDIELEDLSGLLSSSDTVKDNSLRTTCDTSRLFLFDPNCASFDTLTELGFTERDARTIMNYRIKGGRFHQPSDIRKIYGIDGQTLKRLIPYIRIKKDTTRIRYLHLVSDQDQKMVEMVDLNKADSATLESLPGLGPVLSSRIIKYRKLLGGFVSVEQLKEVYGLPEESFHLLEGRVFADSSSIIGVRINDGGFKELSKHPYLNRHDIQAILKFRELKGKITDVNELVDNKVLTKEKAKKISAYLKF